jgi:hypothetical protein
MLQAIDNESFYDIESVNSSQDSIYNETEPEILRENIISNCSSLSKTIIINRILYILLLSSVSFIIYEHHNTIGMYLNKILSLF